MALLPPATLPLARVPRTTSKPVPGIRCPAPRLVALPFTCEASVIVRCREPVVVLALLTPLAWLSVPRSVEPLLADDLALGVLEASLEAPDEALAVPEGVTPTPNKGGFAPLADPEDAPAVSLRALVTGNEYCLPAGDPGST